MKLKESGPLWFEDFAEGAEVDAESPPITEDAILDFARQWDPQYFHIDPEAARSSMFGGLIASGWHTGGICMRMICDAYMLRARDASLGSPGLNELRWHKPVRPGDRLRLRMKVLESRPSRSKPDRGTVLQRWEIYNQKDELVMSLEGYNMFLKRPPGVSA